MKKNEFKVSVTLRYFGFIIIIIIIIKDKEQCA